VRAGQAATLAVGALLAIMALNQAPTPTGAMVAVIAFGLAVIGAVAPVGKRTAEEWAPVVSSFMVRRLGGRARFRSPLPTLGFRAHVARAAEPRSPARCAASASSMPPTATTRSACSPRAGDG
jgi:hypothetical protein